MLAERLGPAGGRIDDDDDDDDAYSSLDEVHSRERHGAPRLSSPHNISQHPFCRRCLSLVTCPRPAPPQVSASEDMRQWDRQYGTGRG